MDPKLQQGVARFRAEEFGKYRELFTEIGQAQRPHTAFIGCADSRVIPNLITGTGPGELFTIRNVANIVPPYRISGDYLATTAAIEYAVNILHVESIVVCGHSNCGGCGAIYLPPQALDAAPNVRKWIELLEPVRKEVDARVPPPANAAERAVLTEQINVVQQLRRLLAYPFIAERMADGKLRLYGFYYVIETGEVLNFDPSTETFTAISG